MTVLAKLLFSEVSFNVPFKVCDCENAEEAINNSSRPEISFLMVITVV
jgi:hypothetical protein